MRLSRRAKLFPFCRARCEDKLQTNLKLINYSTQTPDNYLIFYYIAAKTCY